MTFKLNTRDRTGYTITNTYVVGFAVFSQQVDRLLLAVFQSEIARAKKPFHVRPEIVTIAPEVIFFAVVRRFRFVGMRRHNERVARPNF